MSETSAASTVRRILIVVFMIAAVMAVSAPFWALDLDNAGRPDEAGPGWQLLTDWSQAQRDNNTAQALELEAVLDEIRDHTGKRWLVARDDQACWSMLTNDPTVLPVADEPEVCDNATPVDP